jgi:hypothetical protein
MLWPCYFWVLYMYLLLVFCVCMHTEFRLFVTFTIPHGKLST